MRIIKILVETEEQAQQFNAVIEEAECELQLDFPFTVRITDEMSEDNAKYNLYHDE